MRHKVCVTVFHLFCGTDLTHICSAFAPIFPEVLSPAFPLFLDIWKIPALLYEYGSDFWLHLLPVKKSAPLRLFLLPELLLLFSLIQLFLNFS